MYHFSYKKKQKILINETGHITYHVLFLPLILSSGEGNGTPLQYSCLENPMNGGAW